jgi:hypothetical protein
VTLLNYLPIGKRMTDPDTNTVAEADRKHHQLVEVTLVVDDPDGETETLERSIPAGPTRVPELKAELGVPPEASLWLVRAHGKPKQLVDHETHDVKAGDRYETVVKGGVSEETMR